MKSLDLAILNLLASMPIPVPQTVIQAQLPEFYAGKIKPEAIAESLDRQIATGYVRQQSKSFVGLLFHITPSGRAAIP